MSLVSGPGRGGGLQTKGINTTELELVVDKHVDYIKSLDTVRIRYEAGGCIC